MQLQSSLSFTISGNLLKFMSIELAILSNHLILCCFLLLLPSTFLASGSFPMSQFFESGSQSIGVSALASVLSMSIQCLFSLGLTGLISLQSKGLSRVFSSITVRRLQIFSAQASRWFNTHIHTWKTTALTVPTFIGIIMVLLFNMLSGFRSKLSQSSSQREQ